MKAALILEMIRSRLRDKADKKRFEDIEILDAINSTYKKLIFEFNYNKDTFKKELKDEECFEIFNLSKIINIKINNKKERIEDSLKEIKKDTYMALKSGLYEIEFIKMHIINDLSDELLLNEFFCNALVYGSLCLLLEIETAPENLNKISLYKNLFNEERAFLIAQINSIREDKHHLSRVILF